MTIPSTTAAAGGELLALRERLRAATLRTEAEAADEIRVQLAPREALLRGAQARAARWVQTARADERARPLVEQMLEQFPLDSAQGKALMGLAEALLRTPDPKRADQLISERLATVRAAGVPGNTALLLRTGFVLLGAAGRLLPDVTAQLSGEFTAANLSAPLVAPIVRAAMRQSMQLLGHAFIVGNTIEAALARGASEPELALCSFDMLGEGARTEADAERYFHSYAHAIEVLARQAAGATHARSGISVKLSALEPRYSLLQSARVSTELAPRMLQLARRAARVGIGFTIDAEEADRLDLSLDIVETLARDPTTRDWDGLGLAVQAYGRRAPRLLEWVAALARDSGRRMSVRLVKGAYWDSEIKRAQERGLATFPVYTSKDATDASYLQCVQVLFGVRDVIYPQFATHNAYTVAAVLALAPAGAAYEFQRLHGMGEALYAAARAELPQLPAVRVYAPVGSHEELLPYLVRRLLENGANSSFVHQFLNPDMPVEEVVRDPLNGLASARSDATRIREPAALYGDERVNSAGEDFGDPAALATLNSEVREHAEAPYRGGPLLDGVSARGADVPVNSPTDTRRIVGYTRDATAAEIAAAMSAAAAAQPAWEGTPAVGARRVPRARRRCTAGAPRGVHQPAGARGRQDAAGRGGRDPRGDRFLPLLRGPRPRALRCAPGAARADRGAQHPLTARPRRVRVHQPVELPAGDLHRPDQRRPGGRQQRRGQARARNPAHRARHDARAARGGRARRGAAAHARRRAALRRGRARSTRRSPAWRSPARPRPPPPSTARSRTARGPSCRSSPRPAGSTRWWWMRPRCRSRWSTMRSRPRSRAPASAARRCACCTCRRRSPSAPSRC